MHRTILTICGCATLATALAPQIALADADESSEALAEVTVTAEKQSQNLQKTAAAVTAISAETLLDAGVTDLREAQKLVPSVRFQAEGNNTQVFIRGVGANLDQANVEPNVAFNFAGIYLPREATSAGFFDVEQFEVLPGPQGTLYGRSAIGGTINVTPTRPGFNNEGGVLLEVGNYAAVHATVTQNIKASETLALRAAVDYSRNDGVEETGAQSKNDTSARLSAIFNPTEQLSIYLWGQGAVKEGHTANLVNKGTDPLTGAYCESCFLHGNPWDDTRTGQFAGPFGTPVAERNHYKTYMIGGQVDYNFDWATLSYLPSYLYLDARPQYWLSAIRSSNTAHYNQITQELRLASNGAGPLKWLGGLYFYNVRNDGGITLFTNLPFAFLQDSVDANRLKGYAVFGQATYSITDTLRATLGARGSSTNRTAHGNEPAALGGLPYTFDETFKNLDWKAGIEQDLTPKMMLYGAIQTGFQPGTFNELPNTATFDNEVKPSRLLAYTAGFKSRWLDDSLQINDEVFWYDYRDLLIQSYNIAAAYNTIFNARKVTIKGNQLDILARVFTNDQINLNVGYSQARNKDFITPDGQNYDGLQLAYAPDWSAMAGYTHNIPIGEAMLRAHIDWRFESSWFADYVHNKGTRQGPSNKGDASLTYDATKWSAGAWIKNIQNRAVIAATAAAGVPGPGTSYLDEPRTYGLRFTVSY
ncbi:MAG: iron complex outerrane recepter protein [Gammaproteobacteria bacterium]|nr:iron complex outerrane recepter protein [Gammaproteobacteria bacterium]